MPDLLIHSMSEFAEIIGGCLVDADARHVVEIGAEFGGMSAVTADLLAGREGGRLTSIDPAPKPAFLQWVAGRPHVTHLAATSLEALPAVRDVDAWLIDGDHNYFTVRHELEAVHEACRRDGRPLLAFLHDVGWPAARRDMYYAPERIPAEHRHPYDYNGGVILKSETLQPGRGFRGEGSFAFATHAGGPRNGVLTAVEDFVADHREDRQLAFAHIPAVFGLGVLFDMDAPFAEALAARLAPLHANRLLARLEESRLANYLAVIAWQDAAAEAAAAAPAEAA